MGGGPYSADDLKAEKKLCSRGSSATHANVPVAVVRTMDLEKHKSMVERGVKATVKVNGAGFDVRDAWIQYQSFDANPAKRPLPYTTDLKEI